MSRIPPPVALAALALALGASAGGEDEPAPEEAVRAKLNELATATRGKDYPRLCDRVYDPQLIEDVEQVGLPCEVAMERALAEVREPQLTIGRIRVDGAEASAEVRTAAAGQEPSRDVVTLVRTRDGWGVSSLAGASPPSPAP